ncbi:MAG: YncE family protein [Nitratireductor sp.]
MPTSHFMRFTCKLAVPFALLLSGIVSGLFGATTVAAQSYGVKDARYVVGSADKNTLEYVVCLKNALDRQASGTNLQDAVSMGANACHLQAQRIPVGSQFLNAEDIQLNILECGFKPGDASSDMGCDEGLPPFDIAKPIPNEPDEVFLTPQIIEVGKWAEGLTHDEIWLWVAESGQRTVAKIDIAAGKVVDRFKVGRLPVEMTSFRRELFFTLVATDKIIRRHDEAGPGKVLTKLSECPDGMISTRQTLWVLTFPDCSSETSRIVQVDAINGSQLQSPVLGEWATDLVPHRNKIWVAHARAGLLTIVDDLSLNPETINIVGASFWAIAANEKSVYAAGRVEGTDDYGLITMIDPATKNEISRTYVSQHITKLIADESHIVAVGSKGGVWVFDANSLSLLRTIKLTIGEFHPRAAIIHDGMLVLSSQMHSGENGAALILRDWRPKPASIRNVPKSNAASSIGSVDEDGRTFLFHEQLESPYSNGWSGIRVSGDGYDDTDLHIRSDGKTEFEGIVRIYCASPSGHDWKLSADEAEYSVPKDMLTNARKAFCLAN